MDAIDGQAFRKAVDLAQSVEPKVSLRLCKDDYSREVREGELGEERRERGIGL